MLLSDLQWRLWKWRCQNHVAELLNIPTDNLFCKSNMAFTFEISSAFLRTCCISWHCPKFIICGFPDYFPGRSYICLDFLTLAYTSSTVDDKSFLTVSIFSETITTSEFNLTPNSSLILSCAVSNFSVRLFVKLSFCFLISDLKVSTADVNLVDSAFNRAVCFLDSAVCFLDSSLGLKFV